MSGELVAALVEKEWGMLLPAQSSLAILPLGP